MKKRLEKSLGIILVCFSFIIAFKPIEISADDNSRDRGEEAYKRQLVIDEAFKHIGKPYVWGSDGPDKFDSVGLVRYVYKQSVGIDLGMRLEELMKSGRNVKQEELLPGDLVFPDGSTVSIYMGDGMVIQTFPGQNVKFSKMYKFYRAARIINDENVSISDLAYVANKYNLKERDEGFEKWCDLNTDGIIDIYDIVGFARGVD